MTNLEMLKLIPIGSGVGRFLREDATLTVIRDGRDAFAFRSAKCDPWVGIGGVKLADAMGTGWHLLGVEG